MGLALLYETVYVIPLDNTFDYYFHGPVASLGFTLVIAGILFGGEWLRAVFSFTPLRFIGIISYSMYLWHMPLIYVFNAYPTTAALPPEARFPHIMWLTLVAVVALSTVLYMGVERPFMVLARKKPKPQALERPIPIPASPKDISEADTVVTPVLVGTRTAQ